MEGNQTAQQRSLERLKSLDSLPDLPSQLAEANRLCTHSARADMIAKWLLEKIKSSQETRTNANAWQSLFSTVRLLSPERLATMLSSYNFLDSLMSALEETQSSTILLGPLSNIISFLIEVSETINGAPVKAALSTNATKAASFLGLWLQNMRRRTRSVDDSASLEDCFSLLCPAVQMWIHRKRSTEDSELFAKHCLVPASALLTWSSSEDFVATRKRKRDAEDANSKPNVTTKLESLLAKHIFLPARAAFYKAQDVVESKGRRDFESQNPTFVIESMLQPLKTAAAQGDNMIQDIDFPQDGDLAKKNETTQSGKRRQARLGPLPLLLDIALRCVATQTPRQRIRERPWTEAVFEALRECNQIPTEDFLHVKILTQMLKVIKRRASLSRETLESIARLYWVNSDPPREKDCSSGHHCQLLAQVIELDVDVFTDPKIAETTFTKITEATVDLDAPTMEMEKMDPELSIQGFRNDWQSRWLDLVVIPIMKGFGRSRNLLAFVHLWSLQLKGSLQDRVYSIWVELDRHFQSILEDSIMEGEILELVDRQAKPIADTCDKIDTGEAHIELWNLEPNIVILNGILGGLCNESLVDKTAAKSYLLLTSLNKLLPKLEDSLGPDIPNGPKTWRIWALMTKAFELWFASWTSKQTDLAVVAKKCDELVSFLALDAALQSAKDMRSDDILTSASEASDAECFVASICHHVSAYKEHFGPETQFTLARILDGLFQNLNPNQSLAICLYPGLMLFVQSSQTRREFLNRCIAAAAEISDYEHSSASSLTGVRSLVAAAVASIQTEVAEDAVKVATDFLGKALEKYDEDVGQVSHRKESIAIELLLHVPVTLLTRAQRETLLDVLSTSNGVSNHPQQDALQSHLAFMIKLMEIPNVTSKLSTDHTAIWRMALGGSPVEYVNADADATLQTVELKTISLLEELARLIIKHLMANQDQERTRLTLLDLSTDAKIILEFVCNSRMTHDKALALALCNAVLRELEHGPKQALTQQFPHRDTQKMKELCDQLLSAAAEMIPPSPESDSAPPDSAMAMSFSIIVDTLAMIAELFMGAADAETGELMSKLTRLNLNYIEISWTVDWLKKADAMTHKAALVKAFKVCCKHVAFDDERSFADFALRMLQIRFQPADVECLIDSFKKRVEKLDGVSLASYIEQLLPLDKDISQSHLLLLLPCLEVLGKDDLPTASGSIRYQLLPRLLRIATESDNIRKRQRAISCILIALREKSFLINQHTVDKTLASLPKWLEDRLAVSIAYLDACQIMSALFLNHRARLQGRFHLVNNVYSMLISKLFHNPKESPPTHMLGKQLTLKHAHAFVRALTLFCEPLPLRQKSSSLGLKDESRKEQAHVGQYVQYVLHHYCSQVLNGALSDRMTEALTPGLWAMIEAIEMNDADGIKSLSASMTNSERAVLRGVYDDWKRFGKWRGR